MSSKMCCNYQAMRFCQLSLFTVILAAGTSSMAAAQSPIDHPKVGIEEVELEGSLLPKAAQEQLVSSLKEREWEEGSEWVADLEKSWLAPSTGVGRIGRIKDIRVFPLEHRGNQFGENPDCFMCK